MNKQVSYAYQHLSRTETLFKGENKNINISVSKNSPVNASLSLDGYGLPFCEPRITWNER